MAGKTKKADAAVKQGMVKIRLFKDNERYKDDVFVGLNGKFYTIKRGVDVEVPVGVAKIIEQSLKQRQATQDAIQQMQIAE